MQYYLITSLSASKHFSSNVLIDVKFHVDHNGGLLKVY